MTVLYPTWQLLYPTWHCCIQHGTDASNMAVLLYLSSFTLCVASSMSSGTGRKNNRSRNGGTEKEKHYLISVPFSSSSSHFWSSLFLSRRGMRLWGSISMKSSIPNVGSSPLWNNNITSLHRYVVNRGCWVKLKEQLQPN